MKIVRVIFFLACMTSVFVDHVVAMQAKNPVRKIPRKHRLVVTVPAGGPPQFAGLPKTKTKKVRTKKKNGLRDVFQEGAGLDCHVISSEQGVVTIVPLGIALDESKQRNYSIGDFPLRPIGKCFNCDERVAAGVVEFASYNSETTVDHTFSWNTFTWVLQHPNTRAFFWHDPGKRRHTDNTVSFVLPVWFIQDGMVPVKKLCSLGFGRDTQMLYHAFFHAWPEDEAEMDLLDICYEPIAAGDLHLARVVEKSASGRDFAYMRLEFM